MNLPQVYTFVIFKNTRAIKNGLCPPQTYNIFGERIYRLKIKITEEL